MQTSFETLQLRTELISGLALQNIVSPTPIQVLTYPAFLEGKDLMVESHTGSGKTLAFLLPLFEKIKINTPTNQAIILAPTHELAHQIHEQIKLLAKNSGIPVTSALLMGEVSIEKQIQKLKEKPQILVGSPGRILDLILKKKVSVPTLETILLDEADNLLESSQSATVKKPQILVGSPGRILDLILKKKVSVPTLETILLDEADNLLESSQSATVKKLLHQIGHPVQIAMFSASMTAKVKALAAPFLKEPIFLRTTEQTSLNPNLEHFYIKTELKEKFETLKKLLLATNTQKALIFVSQHTNTKVLVEKLKYHNFTVATISGKLSKEERKNALLQFKTGKVKLLLSSDLSARGLDVSHITHVFHYDLPLTPYDYLHRAGRSARNGEKGCSISILTPKDLGIIGLLGRTFKIKPSEVILVKGRIKNLETNHFIEPSSSLPTPEVSSPAKKRNKYPKGYHSDTPNKKPKKTTTEINDFTSGTLADALRLIEEAGFDKWDE